MSVVLADDFERADTASSLGSNSAGVAWLQYNSANFKIVGGNALKATGSGSIRYFALLPADPISGAFTVSMAFKSNPTANFTDLGVAFLSLDSTLTRGGQVYVSVRKISGTNSVRLMYRSNTSGTDTVVAINSAAGWADNTEYTLDVVVSAPDGSGDRAVDIRRDGVSILTGTLTAAQLATLGTNIGISFTNTDTGSMIHSVSLDDPAATPIVPVETSMECIVHRGIEASTQPVTDEESVTGLNSLLENYPWVNGVELDARVSSDGIVYLFHDSTLNERLYSEATGSVESNASAYLDALGLTRLSTYLTSASAAKLKTIFVQFYVAWVPLTKAQLVVDVINASPVADKVIVGVTGTENGYIDELRTIWSGRIGLYGLDTSNESAYISALTASSGYMGYIVPYDANYSVNRSVVDALHTAGLKAGGSVIDQASTMVMLNADGAEYVLTNEPGVYETRFIAPENPSTGGPMTLQQRLLSLAQAIAADIKTLNSTVQLKKNNSAVTLDSDTETLGQYTVQDDGTSTASWPDRLVLYYRNAAGTIVNKVLWLNEYFELRLSAAKVDTTPLRLFTRSSSSSAAHSATSPIFEIQDNPDTNGRKFAVFPDGSVTALNVDSKVVVVANGASAGAQPDGTVVVELSA